MLSFHRCFFWRTTSPLSSPHSFSFVRTHRNYCPQASISERIRYTLLGFRGLTEKECRKAPQVLSKYITNSIKEKKYPEAIKHMKILDAVAPHILPLNNKELIEGALIEKEMEKVLKTLQKISIETKESENRATSIFSEEIIQVLLPYKKQVDELLKSSMNELGKRNEMIDACEYALMNPGKRFRPAIVMMIAKSLGRENIEWAAIGIEYLHTSSLIADDLPCMDNDDFRRGMPTVHKKWNESIALLASFTLMNHGYECITKNVEALKESVLAEKADEIGLLAIREATKAMGSQGLMGGQYLDLFTKTLDEKTFEEIIYKKTAVLFDLSFTLGWLFGGGDKEQLPLVHEASVHFGRAFQIIDDLDDMEKDRAAGNPINYANFFGREKAIDEVERSSKEFQKCLEKLGLHSSPLYSLGASMVALSTALKKQ